MQFGRYLLLVFTCVALASCAYPRVSHDLDNGKAAFEQGDYKQAFHRLLPIAVNGCCDAQYAVGYMYYYGYGVSEDSESGIFWMTKAAEQGYLPAIKALEMIRQAALAPPLPCETRLESSNKVTVPERIIPAERVISRSQYKDEVIEVLPRQPQMTPYVPHHKIQEKIIPDKPKALDYSERNFTLQLSGSSALTSIKVLQSQLKLKHSGHIYRTERDGKNWYVLTFGNFMSATEASATMHNLPTELRELGPWVRQVGSLRLIREDKANPLYFSGHKEIMV